MNLSVFVNLTRPFFSSPLYARDVYSLAFFSALLTWEPVEQK